MNRSSDRVGQIFKAGEKQVGEVGKTRQSPRLTWLGGLGYHATLLGILPPLGSMVPTHDAGE